MQIRPGVDLGYAFNKFKAQLRAITDAKKETGEDYALNFGRLQGACNALLCECTVEVEEIPTLARHLNNPDLYKTGEVGYLGDN